MSDFTCCYCNKPMRYNIPRLGPGGGYVHTETDQFDCGEKKEVDYLAKAVYLPAMNEQLLILDRQTEFKAENLSLRGECIGCTKNNAEAMLSWTDPNHCYASNGIQKVFDLFLSKEQLEYLVEAAKKILNEK